MNSFSQPFPAVARMPLAMPMACFEVLGYLLMVAVGTLCFLMGWLTPNGAAVLTVLLLASLIVLAWKRFDGGRHPCFLFLCTLLLFQGGRLVGFCLGVTPDPFAIELFTPAPFSVSREDAGIVLLAIVLSAICVYAPCRWSYRRIQPPGDQDVRRYLPYLYVMFFFTISASLVKNYLYFRYALDNGYLAFFNDYYRLAATVPLPVRLIALLDLPVFLALFVLETRKKRLWTITVLYFVVAGLYLAAGSRGGTLSLVLVVWYLARIKSSKRARILVPVLLVVVLIGVAVAVDASRDTEAGGQSYVLGPIELIAQQGNSLTVTELAIKYQDAFRPHIGSYLFNDLWEMFVPSDISRYVPGGYISWDMVVLLNPSISGMGFGTGGSYLAEMYLLAGLGGVVGLSLLLGYGLNLIYVCSSNAWALIVVAVILPSFLLMPRGDNLAWLSTLMRNAILFCPLLAGWWLFSLLSSLRGASPRTLPPAPYGRANA
ncbi:MAG TPA: O-antigen polysaccharide polymerase Wzy [Acidobacteriaceae bacterium]|nr:O-antigen polysaccharide polymerase Wzy [Acidobacteriaceae bacterium]